MMNHPSSPLRCPQCGAIADASDLFCRHCGVVLETSLAGLTQPPSPRARWYHNIWFLLVLLFFVLGPLGLPLVWKHPRLSPRAKWILTTVVLLYTGFGIWLAISAGIAAYQWAQHITESLQPF